MNQKTFSSPVSISGIGLHTGREAHMVLKPAEPDTGIQFQRVDLESQPVIPVRYDHVIDTRMCTLIGTSQENNVSTTEHLMAALYILGIDNALIEIDSPEIPLMDGSAKMFLEALVGVSLSESNSSRKVLKVKKKVLFIDDKGIEVSLSPSENGMLSIMNQIDYANPLIGIQGHDSVITEESFKNDISAARTFGCVSDHEKLKQMGLARGASLDNVLVYTEEGEVMNPGGLRYDTEFARHKVLDSVGDLYTSGYRIIGRYENRCGGHYHNNQILRVLFSDPENYEIIEG